MKTPRQELIDLAREWARVNAVPSVVAQNGLIVIGDRLATLLAQREDAALEKAAGDIEDLLSSADPLNFNILAVRAAWQDRAYALLLKYRALKGAP